MKTRAHGIQLEIEGLGNLLIGEALEIAEYHDGPTVFGQLGDGAVQGRLELGALHACVGASLRIGKSQERLFALAPRPPLPRGETVQTQARDDGVEPGGKLGVSAELRQAPMSPHESLLSHLLGFGGIAQHSEGDAEDAMLMEGDELLEGTDVSGSQPREELRGVGGLSLSHS